MDPRLETDADREWWLKVMVEARKSADQRVYIEPPYYIDGKLQGEGRTKLA